MFNKDLVNLNLMQNKDPFANKKIKFPVTYEIKVIVDATIAESTTKSEFEEIVKKLNIPSNGWRKKLSSKGTYISYTSNVVLKNETLMNSLYSDLKGITGLKMAI